MRANSSPVRSNQAAPHPRLHEIVLRHLAHAYRRVPGDRARHAFDAIAPRLAEAPFVLDAGCGTGAGTFALARTHGERLVVGVDKSAVRLVRGLRVIASGDAPANALLLHCDLVDFWQLAAASGLRCERQYLLYPNPWPKAEQVMRRWHAHPVLPDILALGGAIELRTNWDVYAQEFAVAMRLAGRTANCTAFEADTPITAFERKYAQSGHALCRVAVRALVVSSINTAAPPSPQPLSRQRERG
jgi:tRNA G46 methylase TrmB